MDVLGRTDLPFPQSLPEFQRLFPDDAACAAYLEKARWGDGFACPHCGIVGGPFRIATALIGTMFRKAEGRHARAFQADGVSGG